MYPHKCHEPLAPCGPHGFLPSCLRVVVRPRDVRISAYMARCAVVESPTNTRLTWTRGARCATVYVPDMHSATWIPHTCILVSVCMYVHMFARALRDPARFHPHYSHTRMRIAHIQSWVDDSRTLIACSKCLLPKCLPKIILYVDNSIK